MNRSIMLTATAVALLAALSPGTAAAQTARDLVGTWTAVSNINIRPDGTRAPVFGPRGTGLAIFESNGRYSIINLNPDVPKFTSNNRAQGTAAENKAAMEGAIAHYGTYTYDAAAKVVNLKVEGSTYPNWTGTEQKRTIMTFAGGTISNGRLPLRSAGQPRLAGNASSSRRLDHQLRVSGAGRRR